LHKVFWSEIFSIVEFFSIELLPSFGIFFRNRH